MNNLRYYTNKNGFLDNTAYLVRTGVYYHAVTKDGKTHGVMGEWTKTHDRFVKYGAWIEITEEAAHKLLGANAPKKEVWPRYFVGTCWGDSDAYIRYDSPTSSVWVNQDGVETLRDRNSVFTEDLVKCAKWKEVTKEDALKRVTRPNVKSVTSVSDVSDFKKEEVTMEKETAMTAVKLATDVAKFVGKWGWRTVNYWALQPVAEVATRIMRAVRYVTLTGAIVGGVYAYNNPEKASDLFKSCLPKITIESPEILG